MRRPLLAAIIVIILLHTPQRVEAGQIITVEFSGGTARCEFGLECFEYVEDGVVVTAIPATYHFGPFQAVSFHLAGFPPFDPFPLESTLFVSVEDRGAAEFSFGGQAFDLLSAEYRNLCSLRPQWSDSRGVRGRDAPCQRDGPRIGRG